MHRTMQFASRRRWPFRLSYQDFSTKFTRGPSATNTRSCALGMVKGRCAREIKRRGLGSIHTRGPSAAGRSVHFGGGEVVFTVGVAQMKVCVDALNTFSYQQDCRTGSRRRFVRRVTLTEEEVSRKDAAFADSATRVEDACAICPENFAETPHMPRVACDPCGHLFHGTCINQVVLRESQNARCPLCRQSINRLR